MKEILLKFLGYILVTIAIYIIYFIYFQIRKVPKTEIGYKAEDNPKRPKLFDKIWFKIIATIIAIVFIIVGWLLLL